MSSRQWRGGFGSSPGAAVIVTSAPHTLQRYSDVDRLEVGGVGLGRRAAILNFRSRPAPIT